MQIRFKVFGLVTAAAFAMVSCKEKPKAVEKEVVEEKGTVSVKKTEDKVPDKVVPDVKASLGLEERAAKLGFAKHLPKDTEMLLSVYNTKDTFERFKGLKLYGFMENAMGANMMMDEEFEMEEDLIEEDFEEGEQGDEELAEEEIEIQESPSPWVLLGQEITVAMGESTGEQLGHLLTVNTRMAYLQAKALGKAVEAMAKSGSEEDFGDTFMEYMDGEQIFKDLLNDQESGVALFDKATMPPIYIAFRAKDDEIEQAAQMLNSSMAFFGMAGEMAAPVEFETGGATFAGYKLLGVKMAELMEAEKEDMVEEIGAKNADDLIAAIAKKNLVFATGKVGNYVVMMIGGDEKDMKLTEGVDDSLAANTGMNFVDAYADKQLVTVAYGEGEVLKGLLKDAGGLGAYALGLRDGMMEGDGLGDIRDISELLQMIMDREQDLLGMCSVSSSGTVAFLEDGLKIEGVGGFDRGAVDWSRKTELAHLGDSPDNVLFMNFPSNPEYFKAMGSYFETIFETAYAITMKVSEMEIESEDFQEMKGYAKMFDEKFRSDVLGIYEGLTGAMGDGLGNECALVIDLKGSVPAVPGLPQEVVDQGKAPRMTLLYPVTERAKLAAAWTQVNSSTSKLLTTVSEMVDEQIPMQKPISSEKDGITTWFISFPFFQDDFLPSVSVSDKWFAASTSKTQALNLITKATAGGEKGQGMKMRVNFDNLSDYADEMMAMAEKNAPVLFADEFQLASFNESKTQIKGFIEAFREFESMSWDVYEEGGIVRTSIHFKVR